MNEPIYLIGYRGTGKTTVARLLAEQDGWPWFDADAVLEARAGRTIRDIFRDDGEAAFRDLESAVLRDLAAVPCCFIATGGGVVVRPENRAVLRRGFVVWLTAPAEVLWRRMQADAATAERRPNLAQGGLAEIEALLAARNPLYAELADVTLDTAERTPEQVAAAFAAYTEDAS